MANFNIDFIEFDKPKLFTTPQPYHRIPIKYNDPNRTDKDCYIVTPPTTSYGIQPNYEDRLKKEGRVTGYSLPLVIEDENLLKVIEDVTQKCRDHLKKVEVKQLLKKWNMDSDADVMTPLYRKRNERGEFEDVPPKLYPKLTYSVNPPAVTTAFYTKSHEKIVDDDLKALENAKCKVTAVIVFKDIYIGTKPSMQMKVDECIVEEKCNSRKCRLLHLFKPSTSEVSECVLESLDDDQEVVDTIIRRRV